MQTYTLAFMTTDDSGDTYRYGNKTLDGRSLVSVTGYRNNNEPVRALYETKLGSTKILISSDIAENYPTPPNQEKWSKANQILSTFKFTK